MSDYYFLAEEPFWSIQGEGLRTGEPTTFIRLAGCNADYTFQCWKWCDSKFARTTEGALELTEAQIIDLVSILPHTEWVCITGGEPMLQDIGPLTRELIGRGFQIQVETNGTAGPQGIYHIHHYTLSPKTPNTHPFYWGVAKEVKFVIATLEDLKHVAYPSHFWGQVFLQPMNNDPVAVNLCLEALKEHPRWRLSLQIHKIIGVA